MHFFGTAQTLRRELTLVWTQVVKARQYAQHGINAILGGLAPLPLTLQGSRDLSLMGDKGSLRVPHPLSLSRLAPPHSQREGSGLEALTTTCAPASFSGLGLMSGDTL